MTNDDKPVIPPVDVDAVARSLPSTALEEYQAFRGQALITRWPNEDGVPLTVAEAWRWADDDPTVQEVMRHERDLAHHWERAFGPGPTRPSYYEQVMSGAAPWDCGEPPEWGEVQPPSEEPGGDSMTRYEGDHFREDGVW
jgi:hypothetical protein